MVKIKRWYFNNNYEDFNILYENDNFILIQNGNDKNSFTFGLSADFGTLLGFPVNQSCLTKNECIKQLKRFISIENENGLYPYSKNNIKNYKLMITILRGVK